MEVDAGGSDTVGLRPPSRARLILVVLLPLLVLGVAAGLFVWAMSDHDDERTAADLDREALNAATAAALAWGDVDYAEIDSYFSEVKDLSTGEFLSQFEATETELRDLLIENESVQVATVPKDGAGLIERDGDTARAVVALDATVTNTSTSTPTRREYRVQITMTRIDGRWLASTLELVS